jgi:eukaryotic-like serine/threonine-protein kinase
MNELAGKILNGYQLEEEIGHGSMGIVYRGQQLALKREVAIKVISHSITHDSSYIARFIREAHIMAGLNHPNIVHIYDAGQHNKLLYFVMEFVQGPTLANLLYLDGTIPQHLAAEYAAQIAEALDAAYKERHVIHRDIKPENIMLNRWGKIKVMDFGLARAVGLQAITTAKTLVGSIYYASPEQLQGETLDNRSDVYALGVVLYEMVSGRRPFNARTLPELTQMITNGALEPPHIYNADIDPGLERTILTALSLNRYQRYEEAGLMAQELRNLQLKSPLATSSSLNNKPRHGNWEQIVVQPPKRPQARRPPSYMENRADAEQIEQIEQRDTQPLSDKAKNISHSLPGAAYPQTTPTPPLQEAHVPKAQSEKSLLPRLSRSIENRRSWNALQRFLRQTPEQ